MPETVIPIPTRESLLDAAEQSFSQRGYVAVGIREIAELAGANLASIKYHFGSKRDLYVEMVRRVMLRAEHESPWSILRDAPRGREDAANRLICFVSLYMQQIADPQTQYACGNLMLWEAIQPSEAIDDVVREYIQPGHQSLRTVIQHLLSPGKGNCADACARSVLGQILHYKVFRAFIERLPADSGGAPGCEAPAVATHIVRFSLRGMGWTDDEIAEAFKRTAQFQPGSANDKSANGVD